MQTAKRIGDWTEQRLAMFVQSLPSVQRRRDDNTPQSVAGAIAVPTGGANADEGVWYDGFNWIAGKVTNARVAAGAAIAYSKLNLTTSIVNADIATSAAIVYSKLSLAASIVNADIANAAAIAYSKLNLAASILNADVAATAAIRRYKTSTLPTSTQTTTYVQVATDDLIVCDATAGTFTVTLLPAATAGAGKVVTLKKIDASANAVTVDGDTAETIDGAATYSLSAQWKYVELTCTGTAWLITANN